MESGAHSLLAPSAAERWVFCPGSVRFAALYPGEDNDDTRWGQAAHSVSQWQFQGYAVPPGTMAPNGVVVTEEMVEAAQEYTGDVVEQLGPGWAAMAHVERMIPIHRIHTACFGTPDVFAFDSARRILWLVDAKFGHRYVDPFENWQLLTYLAGVLDFYGLTGLDEQHVEVRFRVIQPRSWHPEGPKREWRFNAAHARPYFNRIAMAAEEAMGNDPKLVVGSYCRDCPGRHACPQLQAAGYRAADLGGKTIARELNAQEVGLELFFLEEAAKLLDARISGLQAQGLAMARGGQRVPFHKVEHAAVREQWSAEKPAVIALGEMLNVSLTETTIKTPSQARKLLKANGIDEAVINHYAKKPVGEARLAPENSNDVRKVFSK